ncbi:hypothetical protein D3C80_1371110 [compost metagenome]
MGFDDACEVLLGLHRAEVQKVVFPAEVQDALYIGGREALVPLGERRRDADRLVGIGHAAFVNAHPFNQVTLGLL